MIKKTIINDSVTICEKCGSTMDKISEDISYKIEVKPAEYQVTKILTRMHKR